LKRILIVDDEKGIRDLLHAILRHTNYVVKSVTNGLEAVELVEKEDFDIIFMDDHMPVMKGTEALKKIKEMKPEQKVVVFNSGSDPESIFETQAKELGIYECLYKPFDIDEVINIIKTVFKN